MLLQQVLVAASKRENSSLTQHIVKQGIERALSHNQRSVLDRRRSLSNENAASSSSSSSRPYPYPLPATAQQQQQQVEQQLLREDDIEFVEYTADEVSQRHDQIRALERDMIEVATMYKDLLTIVNEQQVDIDVVDTHLAQTLAQTQAAHEELVKAEQYQQNARKKQVCICVMLAVAAGIIIALIVVFKKL